MLYLFLAASSGEFWPAEALQPPCLIIHVLFLAVKTFALSRMKDPKYSFTKASPFQSQPGQYQASAQHQYQGPQNSSAPQSGISSQQIKSLLQQTITDKRLQHFYPPNDPRLDQIAARAATKVEQLCAQWRIPHAVGQDLSKLALYDIVLYIDNSGSIEMRERPKRKRDLHATLAQVLDFALLFDDDGIDIRFMNGPSREWLKKYREEQLSAKGFTSGEIQFLLDTHIRDQQTINRFVQNEPTIFTGITPLGTELRSQVLEDIVLKQARANQLRKPVLVITLTDGEPEQEPRRALHDGILHTMNELSRLPCGIGAVAFSIAQIGTDKQAQEFLAELDGDPQVGGFVDCTSGKQRDVSCSLSTVPNSIRRFRIRRSRNGRETTASTSHTRALGKRLFLTKTSNVDVY